MLIFKKALMFVLLSLCLQLPVFSSELKGDCVRCEVFFHKEGPVRKYTYSPSPAKFVLFNGNRFEFVENFGKDVRLYTYFYEPDSNIERQTLEKAIENIFSQWSKPKQWIGLQELCRSSLGDLPSVQQIPETDYPRSPYMIDSQKAFSLLVRRMIPRTRMEAVEFEGRQVMRFSSAHFLDKFLYYNGESLVLVEFDRETRASYPRPVRVSKVSYEFKPRPPFGVMAEMLRRVFSDFKDDIIQNLDTICRVGLVDYKKEDWLFHSVESCLLHNNDSVRRHISLLMNPEIIRFEQVEEQMCKESAMKGSYWKTGFVIRTTDNNFKRFMRTKAEREVWQIGQGWCPGIYCHPEQMQWAPAKDPLSENQGEDSYEHFLNEQWAKERHIYKTKLP